LIAGSWILGEIADSSGSGYLAASRQGFTSKAFCEGRFTGAISPNEPDSITAIDTDSHIFNQESCASSEFNALGGNH
jgi:hypothetical protein